VLAAWAVAGLVAAPAVLRRMARRESGPSMQMSETIHNRIAVLRAERGISRRQLAEALGIHYQTVGYLERGEYSPSLYLALRIAQYFEVPVEVVFSTTPFPRIGSTERSA
jgi:putative transcriptional regulator